MARLIRGHSRSAVRDQRTSEGQPLAAAPTIGNALKAELTALAARPACDQCASAAAITISVYKLWCTTRGVVVELTW